MLSKSKPRTYRTNGAEAKRARGAAGHTQASAAEAWEIGERTIRDIESGAGASPTKIRVFAEHCGISDWHRLLADGERTRLGITGVSETLARLTSVVELEIDAVFEDFDDLAGQECILKLRLKSGALGPIRIVRKDRGSVQLTIELSPADAEFLITAFEEGLLDSLGVRSAKLVGELARPTLPTTPALHESMTVPSELAQSASDSLQDLLKASKDDLLLELFRFIGGYRSGNPLAPYLPLLREALCDRWNWPEKRTDPRWRDPLALATAIVEPLSQIEPPVPFPLNLLASTLVKLGLDTLCDCENSPPFA